MDSHDNMYPACKDRDRQKRRRTWRSNMARMDWMNLKESAMKKIQKLHAQAPVTGPIGEEIHSTGCKGHPMTSQNCFKQPRQQKCSKSYESSFHDQATHGQGSNNAAVNRAPTYKATPEELANYKTRGINFETQSPATSAVT